MLLDQMGSYDLDVGIGNEVSQTLRDLSLTPFQVVENYVRLVHPWLPIIKSPRLTTQLETTQRDQPLTLKAETAALLLFIHLATQSSSNERAHNSDLQRKVYKQCQSMFTLLQAFRRSALETRQCGVLLTTYQLGAGFISDAYVTLSTASGLVHVHQPCPFARESYKDERDDEARRVWWAVFLLDRLIAQSHWKKRSYPLIIEQPPWWSELPSEGSLTAAPIRITDIGTCHCEYFCREIQAAYLAAQTLEYRSDHDRKEGFEPDLSKLSTQLTTLLNVLFETAPGSWRPSCGAIAMIIAATLDLHLSVSGLSTNNTPAQLAYPMETLATTIRINTEIVTNSLDDNDDNEFQDRLPITGVIANYRTALAICHRAEVNQALTTEERFQLVTMTRALQRGRLRWGLADVYLQEISGMLDVW
ncbi:hypothetical protein BGW36DRAFT_177284 [Talaromyces proteolyticus]|uniref:Xylanolytic transcriptional activator regulatory domain-containing protein n=1 Tax=Talaromyces proteolyticus TaxID=1131652 RepID=A0AAD4KQC6_9EURO|nr:uncharacterized protein BGW36DRAFT_177284 [Talaromyces proteolyticus]KAH8697957.1 hypothetical protein BGW36DRAFT_177284 [Talaromyces proteolyticus]